MRIRVNTALRIFVKIDVQVPKLVGAPEGEITLTGEGRMTATGQVWFLCQMFCFSKLDQFQLAEGNKRKELLGTYRQPLRDRTPLMSQTFGLSKRPKTI